MIKYYETKPEPVEAIQLDNSNVDEVARFCGGEAYRDAKSSDPTDVALFFKVPSLTGAIPAKVGDYIVKDERGRFSVMIALDFESKYVERQKPIKVQLHGGIPGARNALGIQKEVADYYGIRDPSLPGPGEVRPIGWGTNSDSP